jgi:hypothetical protein
VKRYPFADLARTMGLSEHQAGVALGLSGSTQQEYRQRGVTERVGDRLACKAGFHPSEVWPDWMTDSIERASRECAADDCTTMFVPRSHHHRYCTGNCRGRVHVRERYRTDPEHRAKENARARQHYAENRDYIRWQQSRYQKGAA